MSLCEKQRNATRKQNSHINSRRIIQNTPLRWIDTDFSLERSLLIQISRFAPVSQTLLKSMNKILITGGAGFIGYFLSQKLLALGLEVVGSLPSVSLWWIQKIKPNLNDKYYLLKELEKEEKQSQRELAKVLGFSLGKLNFVLKALIVKGLVKMENFAHSEQKIQYRYILTLDGIKEKFRSLPLLSSASKRSMRKFCRKSTKLAIRFPHEQRS